jgi:PAXNEB protein
MPSIGNMVCVCSVCSVTRSFSSPVKPSVCQVIFDAMSLTHSPHIHTLSPHIHTHTHTQSLSLSDLGAVICSADLSCEAIVNALPSIRHSDQVGTPLTRSLTHTHFTHIIHTFTYVRTHKCIHTLSHVHPRTHTCDHTRVCVHIHAYILSLTYTYTCNNRNTHSLSLSPLLTLSLSLIHIHSPAHFVAAATQPEESSPTAPPMKIAWRYEQQLKSDIRSASAGRNRLCRTYDLSKPRGALIENQPSFIDVTLLPVEEIFSSIYDQIVSECERYANACACISSYFVFRCVS